MNQRVERHRCAAALRELIAVLEDMYRVVSRHNPDAPDHSEPIGPLYVAAMRAAADAEYRAEIAGYGAVASDMRKALCRLAVSDMDGAREAAECARRNLEGGER
jgi:hypothetical protein